LVEPDEPLGLPPDPEPRVAVLLGPLAVDREVERPGRVDRLLLRVEPDVAVADAFARAVRQVRPPCAVRRDFPEIVLVVEDHAPVVLRPPGDPERRLLLDGVVVV